MFRSDGLVGMAGRLLGLAGTVDQRAYKWSQDNEIPSIKD